MNHPRLLTYLLLAGTFVFPAAAVAQTAAPATTATTKKTPTEAETTTIPATPLQPVVMAEVQVLGSRIRQSDVAGPSPVSVYDKDFIRASGALTLADFMNYLPQNYTGIGAGRGSTPNEFNPEFGQRTETTTGFFNFVLGSADAPPGQTGVSGVSLRGLGSGSTLVLVDGRRVAQSGGGNRSSDSRQGFVDLNTIPLGMVDHIEVITDGASALYGADAVAGVVNVVLKKNWNGSELSTTYRGTFEGGARERQVTLTTGFAKDKLRGNVSIDVYDRSSLKASQRSFSRNQDHRTIIAGYNATTGAPIFGRDLRLNWGYPATVQARTGNLIGITEAGGNDTRFAVVKDGATGTLTLANFAAVGPSSLGNASTIRRGNTSQFLDLISPSERWGASTRLEYALHKNIELFACYSYTDTRGLFSTQPAVTALSATTGFGNFATIVPAAFNPFNQDVLVGLVNYEFGSVTQSTRTTADSVVAGVKGSVFQTWLWDFSAGWQKQKFKQVTRNFNGAAITAALANPDPAQRLNPFLDARVTGATQQAIYDKMALFDRLNTSSELRSLDLTADGDLFDIWGGALKMATGLSYDRAKNSSAGLSNSVAVNPVVTTTMAGGSRESYAAFTELSVPVFGKRNALPLLRRVELQLAGRYEDRGQAGTTTVPKVGLAWVPVQSVLLRGSYSEGFRAPGLTEYQIANTVSTGNSVTDPRRTPATTTGVTVTRGSNAGVNPETSTNEYYGLVLEPPFAKGVNFQVNYYRTTQKDVIQVLTAQTIVNNETAFPGRVTRATPTAADTAANQPGQITAVDITLANFGDVKNNSVDYVLEYRIPWQSFGRWRVNATASRTLKATRETRPGLPAIDDNGDTFAPPKWKYIASVFWDSGPWNASVFVNYLSSFRTNMAGNTLTSTYPIPSQTKIDVRAGYHFTQGVLRGYGKNLGISVGIGNIADEKPPFSDTVFGFNGGLHDARRRTYDVSMNLPF